MFCIGKNIFFSQEKNLLLFLSRNMAAKQNLYTFAKNINIAIGHDFYGFGGS